MRKCVFCKFCYSKDSKVSFHRFPDNHRKNVWLKNMKAFYWTPNKYHVLCSQHFGENCFDRHFNRTILKEGSVPTIFVGKFTAPASGRQCSSEVQVQVGPQMAIYSIPAMPVVKCELNMGDQDAESREASNPSHAVAGHRANNFITHNNVFHDHCYQNTPSSTRKSEQRTKQRLKYSQTRVKVLTQRVKRLEARVKFLKGVIIDLKK